MKTDATDISGITVDPAWRVGIVHSQLYEEEMNALVQSAKTALESAGIKHVSIYPTAGSFEVPLIGAALAEAQKVDALIALGIIVKGETQHAQLLAEQVALGIMDTQLTYKIPFAFEILYVDSIAQARERRDKGGEAAHAALHSLATLRDLGS